LAWAWLSWPGETTQVDAPGPVRLRVFDRCPAFRLEAARAASGPACPRAPSTTVAWRSRSRTPYRQGPKMKTLRLATTVLSVGLAIGSIGCASSQGSGAAAPESQAKAEAKAPPAEQAAPAGAEQGSGSADKPEAGTSASPKTSPLEVLQHTGAMFIINFRNSDMGKQKEAACEKAAAGDPAKKARCMTAATNAVKREGILFEQDDDQNWWYVRFHIAKGKQIELNRVRCEFGTPHGSKITVKTSGPDKVARAQGKVPSELEFDVPDEFTITVHDPARGNIVYESKVGLIGDEKDDKR
jgi:hypothetical protein